MTNMSARGSHAHFDHAHFYPNQVFRCLQLTALLVASSLVLEFAYALSKKDMLIHSL